MLNSWSTEISELIAGLSEQDDQIRAQAIYRLQEIGLPAVNALQSAMASKNQRVADAAREALEFIMNQAQND